MAKSLRLLIVLAGVLLVSSLSTASTHEFQLVTAPCTLYGDDPVFFTFMQGFKSIEQIRYRFAGYLTQGSWIMFDGEEEHIIPVWGELAVELGVYGGSCLTSLPTLSPPEGPYVTERFDPPNGDYGGNHLYLNIRLYTNAPPVGMIVTQPAVTLTKVDLIVDGIGENEVVPEPSSLLALGSLLSGLGFIRRRQ